VAELLSELTTALDAGDLSSAVRAGERAVAADPKSSEAHDLLGRAYGLKAKESKVLEQVRLAKKARAFFARAVELDPANAAALADLALYDMRAPSFLGGGKEKAHREAERVLELDSARGHELLGELAERKKDLALAESEYRSALEAEPRENRARRSLSDVLVRQKRFFGARQLWLERRETDPSDPTVEYELAGIALASGKDLDAAVEQLETCLSRLRGSGDEPHPADVHERLARIYQKLGRRQEASVELEAARRLASTRRDWRQGISASEK